MLCECPGNDIGTGLFKIFALHMSNLRNTISSLIWVPPMVLLVFSPSSSRALNLAWVLLFLLVVAVFVLRFGFQHQRDFLNGMAPAARVMFILFSVGLLLKLLAQVYWGAFGQDISFELNAWVAALAAWMLCRMPVKLVSALIVFALTGFAVVAMLTVVHTVTGGGSAAMPTNAVNWAAGLALILCLGAGGLMLLRPYSARWLVVLCAVVLLMLSIFISNKRGAYFAILWVVILGVSGLTKSAGENTRRISSFAVLAAGVLLVGGMALLTPELLRKPIDNILLGARQASGFFAAFNDKAFLPSGNVDARLYMYRVAMDQIFVHPFMGIGPQGKMALVHTLEERLHAPLFHLHSEPIDAWVAYGLPGLLSGVMFSAGLVFSGLRLRKTAGGPGVMLLGIGLSHFFSGLSNVNTFHNYYQTMFALAAVLPYLLANTSGQGDSVKRRISTTNSG